MHRGAHTQAQARNETARPPKHQKKRLTEEDNFLFLAVALLLLMLASAVMEQFFPSQDEMVLDLAWIAALWVGVLSIRRQHRLFRLGIGFGVGMLGCLVLSFWWDAVAVRATYWLFALCFMALTTWVATTQVLFAGRVNRNVMVGSLCIYLLIGAMFAMLQQFMLMLDPQAIQGLPERPWYAMYHELLYFSFVSLTTMGFGDITPVAPLARFLTVAEGIIGQFYLAVLVASLVGARMAGEKRE